MVRLVSVQVGQPVTYPARSGADGEPRPEVRTAICKRPVVGVVWLRTLGLDGDGQADVRHHGGAARAVNVYPGEHYRHWRTLPGLAAMAGGAFGENFTLQGLLEAEACIGDTFRVGEAVVQISQPRSPCKTLNWAWPSADLMALAAQSGRVGWYMRVLHEGHVQAGQPLELLDRPFPQWSIARVWALRLRPTDQRALRELLDCPALSEDWKRRERSKIRV